MQQPRLLLPHFKDYIKGNWNIYKDYTASQLKPLILEVCQPFLAEEDSRFAQWLESQKTYEKRKSKKTQNLSPTKAMPIIASSSVTNTTTQVNTNPYDRVTDLMLEEQKQDQNLELFLNEEGQLIQNLLQWTAEEDKLNFLRSQLQSNFLVLNKFMSSRREAPQGFLVLALTLCKELESDELHKQSLLFIRICALHQKEHLEVSIDLIKNALIELAYKASDEQAAYGLLKLSYLNNISFKSFPLDSLNRFQERYQMPLKRFLLFLEGLVDYKPLKCLPLTCFIFTQPFYNLLKDSGALLHRNIDPNYQIQFVELLAYSFEGQEEQVSDFIDIFSNGCIQIYGRGIQLLPLLELIIQREKAKDMMFFGSLKHQNTLFKHLFKQLEEERISKLDEETINDLMKVNEDQYLIASKQPRVINTHEEAERRLLDYWKQFAQSNVEDIPSMFDPTLPGCPLLAKLLALFKIKCLTPAQMISFLMMKEQHKFKRIFQSFSTGTGKTTLSLVWMLYSLVALNIRSISCYESAELCENDYGKLYKEAATLYPSIALISREDLLQTFTGADIVFVTTDFLPKLLQHEFMTDKFHQFQLVLDEFDAVLFDNQNNKEIVELFLKFKYFVAFTGSPLEIVHTNTIRNHLGGTILTYPSLEALEGRDNLCKSKELYIKRPEQIEAIVRLCKTQTLATPVVIILNELGYNTLQRKLTTNELPLINLAEATPTEVISLLSSSVAVPQNGRYNTFMLSVKQGRGLDIPTSSAIEKAGGIYVVIAVLPKTLRETEQFKGRTRRMGGKGQYSIILWEKTKGQTAETFLQQRLEAASIEELQRLARQYTQIKAHPLIENSDIKLNQQQINKNDGLQDVGAANEDMKDFESENSEEESDDFYDQDQQIKCKMTQRNQEECKTYGKESDKNHICQQLVASNHTEATENKILGKRTRNQNEKDEIKQFSEEKRVKDSTESMNEKENNQPLADKKAYVRVNEALKVVIPVTELHEFKELDLNNCEDVLAKNQQKQQKAQQSSSKTKRQQVIANKQMNKPKTQREMVDKLYFAGYSESSIHKDMLNDPVRIEQYTKAIKETCKDKVVLDLGCGTGLLSVLAIKAGATKVYAIDNADIEKLMNSEFMQHIKEGKIEFIKGTIEKLASDSHPKIPKVDVVVSEWMGYFLIFENMMSSYILAIKTFLKPGGIVVPSRAAMYLDAAFYDFGDNSIAKKHLNPNDHCKLALIEQLKAGSLLSGASTSIKTFDFTDNDLLNPLDSEGFACNFKISVAKAGIFNAFVGSFDTKLCNGVSLDTMPLCPATHWKQSIFFISSPIKVEIGDVIEGEICVKTQEENHRNLLVSLAYKVEGKGSLKIEELFSFE